jgi:hypothetical protein
MNVRKKLFPVLLVCTLFISACVYIVLPAGLEAPASARNKALNWNIMVTNMEKTTAGDLRIDLAIRNDTGEWSTMRNVSGKPAVLTSGGKSTNCSTVFVGTGSHRLAPGFQMRGYMSGTKANPEVQHLYVECANIEGASGAKLTIDYEYFNGDLDYYHQEDNKLTGKAEVDLDEIITDLTYPVGVEIEGVIEPADTEFLAVSDNVVTLKAVTRTDTGLEFTWENFNPTDFPLKTHIGNPPVIGNDGIIYGIFEIMDLAYVPLTPSKSRAEWETVVAVPALVDQLYILLSVETKNVRNYVSHAVDITDQ